MGNNNIYNNTGTTIVFPDEIRSQRGVRPIIKFTAYNRSDGLADQHHIVLPIPASMAFSDGADYNTIDLGSATNTINSMAQGEGIGAVSSVKASQILQIASKATPISEQVAFATKTIINPNTNTSFVTNKVRNFGFVLAGLSLGVTLFVAVMPDSFWQRQFSLTSKEDTSLNRRAAYIGVAMKAFIERPVFGTGPDSFYHIFAQTPLARISELTGEPLGRYAHNTYLEILVGTGLSGLFIFLVILGKSLITFTQVTKRYRYAGQIEKAHLVSSYRLFLFLVLLYLVIFSESHHKFMLLGLVLSQISLRLCDQEPVEKAVNNE